MRQPKAIALAPAAALQWQMLGVGLLLGLGTAGIFGLRSRQIVTPIRQLAVAADAIRRGNIQTMIPTFRRQDEIATLSTSLQDLVKTTQEQRDRLLLTNQQLQSDLQRHQQGTAMIQEQAALLNIATDAIIVRDLDWNIRFWNKGAEQLYGWSAQEACNQNAYHY